MPWFVTGTFGEGPVPGASLSVSKIIGFHGNRGLAKNIMMTKVYTVREVFLLARKSGVCSHVSPLLSLDLLSFDW